MPTSSKQSFQALGLKPFTNFVCLPCVMHCDLMYFSQFYRYNNISREKQTTKRILIKSLPRSYVQIIPSEILFQILLVYSSIGAERKVSHKKLTGNLRNMNRNENDRNSPYVYETKGPVKRNDLSLLTENHNTKSLILGVYKIYFNIT
jgi:hypothetical protein